MPARSDVVKATSYGQGHNNVAWRRLEAKAWPRGLRHSRLDTHSHVLFLSSGTVYMQTCYCAIVSLVSREAQRHFLFDNCCYHAWLTRSAASL